MMGDRRSARAHAHGVGGGGGVGADLYPLSSIARGGVSGLVS